MYRFASLFRLATSTTKTHRTFLGVYSQILLEEATSMTLLRINLICCKKYLV